MFRDGYNLHPPSRWGAKCFPPKFGGDQLGFWCMPISTSLELKVKLLLNQILTEENLRLNPEKHSKSHCLLKREVNGLNVESDSPNGLGPDPAKTYTHT